MNEVLRAIKNRRSVRKYKSEQIDQKSLDLILEAGSYAPSAHNDQSWHFTVVQNKELLKEMNAVSKEAMSKSDVDWMQKMCGIPGYEVSYNAPTLIVVSGRKNAMAWEVDCAAAIQNMLIAAQSLAIGSVWLGLMQFYFETQDALVKLGIPEGYQPFYAVAFGYKADEKEQNAPRRVTGTVNYIK